MAHKFNRGDLVTVLTKNSVYEGARGRVERSQDDDTYLITLESGKISGFFERELEAVHGEKDALIRLAETLDLARKQAEAIDIYTIQHGLGVQGEIVVALKDTLEVIIDETHEGENNAWHAGRVFGYLIEGNSVREALKKWETEK
jgi:hypothetical protein